MMAGTVALGTAGILSSLRASGAEYGGLGEQKKKKKLKLQGSIHHSVCRWCYDDIPLDQLCDGVKKIGFDAIDLVATAGYQDLICFSGNREGMDDETGLVNCVNGLKKIIGQAERKKVIIYMELLNSKVNHPDQMCDNSKWGIELVKRIGSENFKLLYDIYHMQIDEGDVIRTITDHHQYFGHYHTGGVPGRHEIDDTQELCYPAIMRAILATGYTGYVAQEFIPTMADKLAALEEGVKICDV
jgi:hydroxypyruvate isomerase